MVAKTTKTVCRSIHHLAKKNDLFLYALVFDGQDIVELVNIHDNPIMTLKQVDEELAKITLALPHPINDDTAPVIAEFAGDIATIYSRLKNKMNLYGRILKSLGHAYDVDIKTVLGNDESDQPLVPFDTHKSLQ